MTKLPFSATLAATLAIGLLAGHAAMAQTISPAAAAGRWLYDADGHTIGSVIGPMDGGSSAEVMVGVYFKPGSHLTTVPAGALYLANGKVTLQTQTVQALNLPSRK